MKERYGAEHYQQLGSVGGRKLVEARGKEYLAAIGRMGGSKKKAPPPLPAAGEAE